MAREDEYRAAAFAALKLQCLDLEKIRRDYESELRIVASYLGRFVASGHLDRDDVVAQLVAACRHNRMVGVSDEKIEEVIDLINAVLDDAACNPVTADDLGRLINSSEVADAIEINRLAQLNAFDYDRERAKVAKQLGIREKTLDLEVEKRREELKVQAELSFIRDIEPYPNAVDGGELLDEITATIRKYMVMRDGEAAVVALYVLYSHVYTRFSFAPRLLIKSVTKGSGKTRLCTFLSYMLNRACPTSNITTAGLFRVIDFYRPSMIVDEADTFAKGNEAMRGIINSGHMRRFAYVLRYNNAERSLDQLSTFAPMVIALIGDMPDTIEDRSVIITLRKKAADQMVPEFSEEVHAQDFSVLGAKAARWATDHARHITTRGMPFPERVRQVFQNDRACDNWAPLIAIAKRAGGRWPVYVETIAGEIALGDRAPIGGISDELKQLLRDMATIFDEKKLAAIQASDLLEALIALPDSRWSHREATSEPLSSRRLGLWLRKLNITPQNTRSGKLYARTSLIPHWQLIGLPDEAK